MAEKVQLRDYQKSILDRLESVKNAGTAVSASYLGVVIGGKNVLIDLQDISETLPIVDIQPVPLVKPWFLGVSNVRGVLYAVNDLAQLLENTFTSISSNTRLMLIGESVSANVAFLADRLIGLRSLDAMQKIQDETNESICLKPESYEDAEKRVWHVLDCDRLVHSKEFATPYAT
jgi:twitching motility protein PilI